MFISSDTNIWIDFFELKRLDHPFLMEHQYYLSSAAFEDELIQSTELREALLQNGLRLTELTDEEFDLAQRFRAAYKRLSSYDAFALANRQSSFMDAADRRQPAAQGGRARRG